MKSRIHKQRSPALRCSRLVRVRLERAENVCRELRHAITEPKSADWHKVGDLLLKWLRVGPASKYERAP